MAKFLIWCPLLLSNKDKKSNCLSSPTASYVMKWERKEKPLSYSAGNQVSWNYVEKKERETKGLKALFWPFWNVSGFTGQQCWCRVGAFLENDLWRWTPHFIQRKIDTCLGPWCLTRGAHFEIKGLEDLFSCRLFAEPDYIGNRRGI